MLTETDWDDLREMLTLLEPFKIVTMLGQERGTRYGSVTTILWGIDILLDLLEKAKTLARPNDSGFKKAINLSGSYWISTTSSLTNLQCILYHFYWTPA